MKQSDQEWIIFLSLLFIIGMIMVWWQNMRKGE